MLKVQDLETMLCEKERDCLQSRNGKKKEHFQGVFLRRRNKF